MVNSMKEGDEVWGCRSSDRDVAEALGWLDAPPARRE